MPKYGYEEFLNEKSRYLGFWRKHSDLKDWIDVSCSIISLIIVVIALFIAIKAYDKILKVSILPESALDICPHMWCSETSLTCGSNVTDINSVCKKNDELNIRSTIYNKGLAISTNINLEVSLFGFEPIGNNSLPKFITTNVNGVVMSESKSITCQKEKICSLTVSIDTLEPNSFVNTVFLIPKENILTYPDTIKFSLKENGKPIIEKTFHILYD